MSDVETTTPRDRRPLARQISDELRARILDDRYAAGDQLPSELALTRAFDASRATIREALKILEQDGLLICHHGRGHFVTGRHNLIRRSITELQSVTELARDLGLELETEVIAAERVTASVAGCAEALGLAPRSPVFRLERTRRAAGETVIYSVDVFSAALIGDGDAPDWETPLFAQIEAGGRRRVDYSTAEIRAVRLDRQQESRAGAPRGLAWLLLEQVNYTEAGEPLVFSHDYHRGDVFRFSVVRQRVTR
jgi:GntR family transcriptional regulator